MKSWDLDECPIIICFWHFADRTGISEVAMVEEMCSPGYEPNCDANYAYRTISGQCNNLQ